MTGTKTAVYFCPYKTLELYNLLYKNVNKSCNYLGGEYRTGQARLAVIKPYIKKTNTAKYY